MPSSKEGRKCWRIEPDGPRVLVKAGRPGNRYQEPFNEVVVTGFCDFAAEVLRKDPFVANDPGRIEKIREALQERISLMNDTARRVR